MAYYHYDGKVREGKKWGARTFDSQKEAEEHLEDSTVYCRMPAKSRVYPRGGAGEARWSYQENADEARKIYEASKALLEDLRAKGASHEEIMKALSIV